MSIASSSGFDKGRICVFYNPGRIMSLRAYYQGIILASQTTSVDIFLPLLNTRVRIGKVLCLFSYEDYREVCGENEYPSPICLPDLPPEHSRWMTREPSSLLKSPKSPTIITRLVDHIPPDGFRQIVVHKPDHGTYTAMFASTFLHQYIPYIYKALKGDA